MDRGRKRKREEEELETDVWRAGEQVGRLTDDMAGYKVETQDGALGHVDRVSYSGDCLFVSTGRLVRHRYLIPAGVVERVDREKGSLVIAVTREQVEQAPAYDGKRGLDDEYERQIGSYYRDLLATRSSAE